MKYFCSGISTTPLNFISGSLKFYKKQFKLSETLNLLIFRVLRRLRVTGLSSVQYISTMTKFKRSVLLKHSDNSEITEHTRR
jgi:hypothetical protein